MCGRQYGPAHTRPCTAREPVRDMCSSPRTLCCSVDSSVRSKLVCSLSRSLSSSDIQNANVEPSPAVDRGSRPDLNFAARKNIKIIKRNRLILKKTEEHGHTSAPLSSQ